MNIDTSLLLNHKSVRRFRPEPVDKTLIRHIVKCAQHAATSEFIQAYTVIHITDEELKHTIYREVATQETVLNAPVFLVFCADVNRLLRAGRMNGEEAPETYLKACETFLMASSDTAIAAQNAVVAAEAEGLGCTYIGGIRNHLRRLCELLQLPKGVYPLFGMVMGYPLENTDEAAKPRLPLDVVYKENFYDTEGDDLRLKEYDEVIRSYYIERTGGQRNETWTQQMTDFIKKAQRPQLKKELKTQGFFIE